MTIHKISICRFERKKIMERKIGLTETKSNKHQEIKMESLVNELISIKSGLEDGRFDVEDVIYLLETVIDRLLNESHNKKTP